MILYTNLQIKIQKSNTGIVTAVDGNVNSLNPRKLPQSSFCFVFRFAGLYLSYNIWADLEFRAPLKMSQISISIMFSKSHAKPGVWRFV